MRKLVIIVVFATASVFGAIDHPWTGKKVVFLGDSITDPNQIERRGRNHYWQFLADDCDLYSESGLLPCDPAYAKDFADGGADGKDNLHPSTSGHRRLAKVIAGHLRVLPPDFK